MSQLNVTARQRRSRKQREGKQRHPPTQLDSTTGQRYSPQQSSKQQPQSPTAGTFEDSTDGVASILKRKLQQLELDGRGNPISSLGTNRTPECSDEGHSSDAGTQTPWEDDEEGEDGGDRGGRIPGVGTQTPCENEEDREIKLGM